MLREGERVAVLDPTGKIRTKDRPLAPRLEGLDGKILGIVDDGMPNCDAYLDRVVELLSQRFKLGGVVKTVKPSMSSPLPQKTFQDMLKKADFFVVGLGV